MSTFTAVDLSRLPAPTIIEQLDYEQILAAMLANLRALDPFFDALVESDPLYKLLQVAAYREMNLRADVNDRAKGTMLAYATGSNLDHVGALLGVQRHMLDAGDPMQSIPPTYESDTDFRRRIQLAPEGFSVAGPEGAYIFHALNAAADVLDASATSPTPGEVVVSILSRVGDGTASPALVDLVASRLAADDVRPMTDHVTVQAASVVTYAVQAQLYTFAGPDAAVVVAEAIARAQQFVTDARRLGRDIPRSALIAALHSEGVQRVVLVSPAADIAVARTAAAYCTGFNVTHAGVDE